MEEKENMILLATYIAMELACGRDDEEIRYLRDLINQISCSLTNLLNCRIYKKQQV